MTRPVEDSLQMAATVDVELTWDYRSHSPRLRSLYDHGKRAQWDAAVDIDWSIEVPFGEPLPDNSAWAEAEFAASPLAAGGRRVIDTFRWEFQAWMVSQFLHGEQGALIAASRLAEVLPDIDSKLYAAEQAADEARHVEAFLRYVTDHIPVPYAASPALAELLGQVLRDSRWDIVAVGMQILIEGLAMAAFRLAKATFHDPLVKQISDLIARDEARHVSFGVVSLKPLVAGLTAAERADREDFVLEASSLLRRRFLLEDVWERLAVPPTEGQSFALTSPMMISYRQTLFVKIVSALANIGMLTPRVRAGLDGLGLMGSGSALAARMAEADGAANSSG